MSDPETSDKNPLEHAMDHAELQQTMENLKESMSEMLAYARAVGQIQAARYSALVAEGVPPEHAAYIVGHSSNAMGLSSEGGA